jgi:hypothetical protein
MSHYTEQEWASFKKHLLSEEMCQEMEQHLQVCDSCMNLWLGLITEAEIDDAAAVISDDFGLNTMKLTQVMTKNASAPSSPKSKKRRLLAYYTAAAAVTLILVSGGVFQNMVNGLASEQPRHISAMEGPAQLLYSWPQQLSKSSNEYWDRLENITLKGVTK